LSYAVPVEIDALVAQGRVVVVNVSRSVVPLLRDRYMQGRVVLIDAPPHILRARLAQRGREDDLAVRERLGRKVDAFQAADADFSIDNSGPIDAAAQRLADYLASFKMATLQAGSA
jgi:ribose 1,5-bisphosphokinase